MSPTARSLAYLRDLGMRCQVVERWNPYAKRRVDLFGFIDIVALDGQPGVLGVQTTTQSNVSARVAKLSTVPVMGEWIAAGNRLVIHGWALRGARGQRKRWTVHEYEIDDPIVPLGEKEGKRNERV